jgi:hypothetical protein
MAKDYSNSEYAFTIAELIEKHHYHESKDARLDPHTHDAQTIAATTKYFVQSSKNWFPSVISLDKSFRQQ